MPTVKNILGPYRVYFYSFDRNEPKHVHVQREKNVCKFWFEPLALCSSSGFAPHELNQVRQLIQTNLYSILEAWNEHCE